MSYSLAISFQNFKHFEVLAKIGNDLKLVANFDNELSLKFVIELRSLLILVRHMSYSSLILATTSEKIDNQ